MGRVHHDGDVRLAHDGEATHVGDEIAVAEARPAFAGHEAVFGETGFARRGAGLFDDVLHVARSEELSLLDVDGTARDGAGADEVRLTAKEGGRLQDVDRLGDDGDFFGRVHVREDGDADLFTDALEDAQALFHAGAAEGRARRAVGLVVARLEDVGNAEFVGHFLEGARDVEGHLLAFEHAGAGDQKEGAVETDFKSAELHDGSSFQKNFDTEL